VHLTGGILRHFQALSTPKQNPALEVLSTSAHPQVTQTVGPNYSIKRDSWRRGDEKITSQNSDNYLDGFILFIL
jgi:hypothetical protein